MIHIVLVIALSRVFFLLVQAVIDFISRKEGRMFIFVKDGVTLCRSCVFAHIVSGKGKSKTFCCYSGPVRPIEFAVSDCTDYRDKTVPERRATAGFVALGDVRTSE